MSNTSNIRFKVSIIGDGRVGKTSLLKKFTESSFMTDYIRTLGAQFSIYDSVVNGETIKLVFWDIAGQDDFHFLQPSFYKNSRATIIVFSLEENDLGIKSFSNINSWLSLVREHCGNIPVVLFANKVDLISFNENIKGKIESVVSELKLEKYFVTSALTGKRVHEAFNFIIRLLYDRYQIKNPDL